ncbi:hypothetical protein CC86DRAFT_119801 [Ophiobolus disseminans]|uniref:Uncharacterized protein n=1 Tax=Ophiobolus disseminans TaxID=1469910 RepID=A0A6A6ZI11_9PLEO|nr:hypothetical protein CC86DRAFT_119801 [Ophiobolus disseminans]
MSGCSIFASTAEPHPESRLTHSLDENSETSREDSQSPAPFIQVYHSGMVLFKVCRQIYEEASSMFYSGNTFTIARKQASSYHVPDSDGTYINEAVPWLKRLGSRTHLLLKIKLDLDTLCPLRCGRVNYQRHCLSCHDVMKACGLIDIGLLMRAIWEAGLQLAINVVHSGNGVHANCLAARNVYSHRDVPKFDLNVTALSNIIQVFQRGRDGYGKRRLKTKQCWRTIGHIGMERDGSGGLIFFSSTND